MNEPHLYETLEQVINLIPRYSWAIMDEAQKDELMIGIVLPRYMAVTSDGTKLNATCWASILETTAQAIKDRVYRLRQKASQIPTPESHERAARDLSAARRVTRNPETRAAFIESLPLETKVEVAKALAATPTSTPISETRQKETKAITAPLKRTMNTIVAQLSTVTLIDQATAEINKAVQNDGLTPDAFRQIEEAVERLVTALEFAKSMAE